MRVPVVESAGKPLMPCTAVKARSLLRQKKARPKRNKLGIFYVQLTYAVEQPNNQPLVVGIDPGSAYEGYSVVGTQDTVLNIMAEASTHVKDAVEVRRNMRRARRHRNCRRRQCKANRLGGKKRIPPEKRLYYTTEIRLYRRQLHRFQPAKGGIRKPYGGTRSLGLKRGTLVNHPKYGLCSVGGFDSMQKRISLNAYVDNKRLTQGAKVQDCQRLTFTPYRTKFLSN